MKGRRFHQYKNLVEVFGEDARGVASSTSANRKSRGGTEEILQPKAQGSIVCNWGFDIVEYPELKVQGHSA